MKTNILRVRKTISIIHIITTIVLIILSLIKFSDEGRGIGYYLLYVLPLCSIVLSFFAYVMAKWWLLTITFIGVLVIYTVTISEFSTMFLIWMIMYVFINVIFSSNIRQLQSMQ